MSLGRSPCDSLVLKDDKSIAKVADFNDSPLTSGHTRYCQFKQTRRTMLRSDPTWVQPSWVTGYTEVFVCDWSKYRN